MAKTFQTKSQFFVLTTLCTIVLMGCGDSGTQPNAAADSATPRTAASREPVSAPDMGLEEAAMNGNTEAVRQHIAAGTDLNKRNPESGSTALSTVATFGQTEVAILLIEGGADLEVKNNEGSTVLITAAFLCREDIVKALLAKGADRNARNNAGSTALESVAGPFDEVKPIYDILRAVLGPLGLELDYERIRKTRPKIAKALRAE